MSDNYSKEDVARLVANAAKEATEKAIMVGNSSIEASFRERIGALTSGGYDYADTLHNIYLDYGYPAQISFYQSWNMYRRFGIAKNVVELYPETGWLDPPEIEASDASLKDIETLVDTLGLWNRLKGLDTRQRVGRYAGLFMRIRDGLKPSEPIVSKQGGIGGLVDMIPLYESQLKVITTQTNVMMDDYGQPTMYEFRGSSPGARDPDVNSSFNIHPSRVIIASEDSDNGSIYGVSALEAVYNSLMDLRKIAGAGGEGFYKNAAQSVVFNLKDANSASKNKQLLDEFSDNYDDFAKNRSRRAMWTPGMEAKTLESSLTAPEGFFKNSLADVAAGSRIPATILVGQQTGRLASDQDARAFLSNVQSRKENFQSEIVTDVLKWLMGNGIIAASEFSVEWPDSLAASDTEKLTNADKMADVNTKMFNAGQDVVFSSEEIRIAAGHEAEMEGSIDDNEDDDENDLGDEELEDVDPEENQV